MSYLRLASIVFAGAAITAAHAQSSPPNLSALFGTSVVQVRTTLDIAFGSACLDGACASKVEFQGQSFDDANGVRQGAVIVTTSVQSNVQSFIACIGPAFAASTTVNPGNGNATVLATLDPFSEACFGFGVGVPVTINLVGQANGDNSESFGGVIRSVFSGVTFKSNFTQNDFSATFNGSIDGFSGSFDGRSLTVRRTDRQRSR